MIRLLQAILALTLCLATITASAGSVHSGAYVVRYAVINSTQIPAAVAEANAIRRRGDRAIVTVTLQHPSSDDPLHAVPARVTGSVRTLMGEHYKLDFRRVDTDNSVYSLASIKLHEQKQTLTLALEVTTLDGSTLIPVEFSKTLYQRTQ